MATLARSNIGSGYTRDYVSPIGDWLIPFILKGPWQRMWVNLLLVHLVICVAVPLRLT